MDNFVNETVRCVSPVIHMRRTTLQKLKLDIVTAPMKKLPYGMEQSTLLYLKIQIVLIFSEKMQISTCTFGIGDILA